jgi:NADP-dependent 3-hydroxy acid dehydrogenase YdfG
MPLTEKVALITGAAAGIGEAIAHLFSENGARVFLLDRDGERNQAAAASIREAGGWPRISRPSCSPPSASSGKSIS